MTARADRTAVAWHALDANDVAARLETSATRGLGGEEAARRLAEHGPNEIQAAHRVPPWRLLLDQFKNVLILILLVAVALSAALGHATEAVVVTVIVLFAVVLGFVQEYRAERAIEALRELAAPTATVVRDGEEVELPARDLVPGDLVLVGAGDKVPADARVTESVNLQVEEAALTGESVPVSKRTDALDGDDVAVADRANSLFAGTAVTYGRGRALVVATGMETEFGRIAHLLQGIETAKTPLQRNLDRVAGVLARAGLAVVLVVVALGLLRDEPFVEMLLFGTALAVAVVPEALPAVVTISLTLAATRMAKRNALIRRLPATETLGSVTVIGSDKTGTLTKDEMTARKLLAAGELVEVSGAGYAPEGSFSYRGAPYEPSPVLLEILRGAVLASDAQLVAGDGDGEWEIRGDPTEGALVVAAAKAGLDKRELDAQCPRVGEIPFTAESKRMTTLHETSDGVVAYTKGAPEIVLASCTRQLTAAGEDALDVQGRDAVLATAQELAGDALRVLAVARKHDATLEGAEQGLTFVGLVGMIDPPRPEARDAIETCRRAGIKAVMITGDHPATARAIATELGLLGSGRVVTGSELEGMADDELARDVDEIEVYARVSPAHKLRVVTALQDQGHSVAMTGDGVNDAPALKKADIGIAMGITGTDVTKEAAAMTLTDDNFASIVAAVEEGRRVFGNIKKYLMYLLSANLGEIGLLLAASVAGQPLPLTAVLILYINLATDGLPALALSVDPPEQDLMQHRPRDRAAGIFTRPVVALIALGGAWSAAVNTTLFIWALESGRSLDEAITMTFVSLALIEFIKAYSYRSERHSVLRAPFANRWLNLAVLWELALLGLVVYLPFLQGAFGTVALSADDVVLVLLCAVTILPVLEAGKWLVRRGVFDRP
ncbi:MAG: ATPase, P-type (transporting), superfamily, subfamily [Gaiellaceae bacterium]|nr:ATPase, P-type (transporting), superfamily, subfamily [Gaiellaceae bacterium]